MKALKTFLKISATELEDLKPTLEDGSRVTIVDLAHCNSIQSAISRIAFAANASETFGHNLSALLDVLCDRPVGNDVIILYHFSKLENEWQQKLQTVFERCDSSRQYGEGTVMIVILTEN
jgi:hypothetical protein